MITNHNFVITDIYRRNDDEKVVEIDFHKKDEVSGLTFDIHCGIVICDNLKEDGMWLCFNEDYNFFSDARKMFIMRTIYEKLYDWEFFSDGYTDLRWSYNNPEGLLINSEQYVLNGTAYPL